MGVHIFNLLWVKKQKIEPKSYLSILFAWFDNAMFKVNLLLDCVPIICGMLWWEDYSELYFTNIIVWFNIQDTSIHTYTITSQAIH